MRLCWRRFCFSGRGRLLTQLHHCRPVASCGYLKCHEIPRNTPPPQRFACVSHHCLHLQDLSPRALPDGSMSGFFVGTGHSMTWQMCGLVESSCLESQALGPEKGMRLTSALRSGRACSFPSLKAATKPRISAASRSCRLLVTRSTH